MKLHILNIEKFLETINACRGKVYFVYPDGRRENINKHYSIQRELRQRFNDGGNVLAAWLRIEEPKDYMHIVAYYAGDC